MDNHNSIGGGVLYTTLYLPKITGFLPAPCVAGRGEERRGEGMYVGEHSDVIVVGDLHGRWSFYRGKGASFNELIIRKKPTLILQCGDFGWWPALNDNLVRSYRYEMMKHAGLTPKKNAWNSIFYKYRYKLHGVKCQDTEVRFAPGNHEDWDALYAASTYDYKIKKEFTPSVNLYDKVHYQKFGSTFTLPDGRVVMFCGGAKSIDREDGIMGRDWFPQEEISYDDMNKLPPEDSRVDIVISHTCPMEFLWQMHNKGRIRYNPYKSEQRDPSRDALSYILETWRPSLWYFGHFHRYMKGEWKDTEWHCMGMLGQTGWWQYLKGE